MPNPAVYLIHDDQHRTVRSIRDLFGDFCAESENGIVSCTQFFWGDKGGFLIRKNLS